MTPTTAPPVRSAARAPALAVVVLAALGLTQACADTRRSLGAECLKSQDCASGNCAQFQCTAPPPTIDVEESADAAPAEAEGGDEAVDASSDD